MFRINIKDYVKIYKNTMKKRINPDDPPKAAIFQVGNVEASNRYIRNKIKDFEEVGIQYEKFWYEDTITTEELIEEIYDKQNAFHAVFVQLPLPPQIDVDRVSAAINLTKDVDGFRSDAVYECCTPKGIIDYLEIGCKYDFDGKNVVVIGRSKIVGEPLAKMLLKRNATVTICHSHTRNVYAACLQADLVICAVGKADFLDCSRIRCNVVDVGINFKDGKLVGDCYNTKLGQCTPVPGGVGLLTRAALIGNIVVAKEVHDDIKTGKCN